MRRGTPRTQKAVVDVGAVRARHGEAPVKKVVAGGAVKTVAVAATTATTTTTTTVVDATTAAASVVIVVAAVRHRADEFLAARVESEHLGNADEASDGDDGDERGHHMAYLAHAGGVGKELPLVEDEEAAHNDAEGEGEHDRGQQPEHDDGEDGSEHQRRPLHEQADDGVGVEDDRGEGEAHAAVVDDQHPGPTVEAVEQLGDVLPPGPHHEVEEREPDAPQVPG